MKWLFLIILIVVIGQVNAQTITFNKRFKISCSNTILTGLAVTDSCHYITGVARDTANCQVGGLFLRIDSLGEVIDFKVHLDSNESYQIWEPCLRKDVDGNFIVAGNLIDTTRIGKAIVIKYDNSGNELWKKKYKNLFQSSIYSFSPEDIEILGDSTYILVGQTGEGFQLLKLSRRSK